LNKSTLINICAVSNAIKRLEVAQPWDKPSTSYGLAFFKYPAWQYWPLNAMGNIPAILGHWQMTGDDAPSRAIPACKGVSELGL
jgi:hypothetical protein